MENNNIKEIIDFTNTVFNYYNGKINIVNSKAVLDINLIDNNDMVLGFSKLPNIVSINIGAIINLCKSRGLNYKLSIIEIIIHELYHTDQIIDYSKYMNDIMYCTYIENACDLQTYIYMAGNLNEISYLIGYDCNLYYNNLRKQITYYACKNAYYYRRYYNDHLLMCLKNLLGINAQEILNIINNINNYNIIDLRINNEIINIKRYENKIAIEELNARLLNYSTTIYDIYIRKNYKISETEKYVLINVDIDYSRIMCKIDINSKV